MTAINSGSGGLGRLLRRPEFGSFVGLIVTYAFFAVLGGPVFLGSPGWSSWLNMASEVGVIALPVGLLMIAGELDISVGSILPASSLTVAILSGRFGLPIVIGIAGGLGVGLAVGFFNGVLVTRSRIPSLILTIGTMFGVMGLTLGFTILIAGSTGVFVVPDPVTKSIFGAALGGMDSPLGAVVGGFLVGALENLMGAYVVGQELKLSVALMIIVGVLAFKRAKAEGVEMPQMPKGPSSMGGGGS